MLQLLPVVVYQLTLFVVVNALQLWDRHAVANRTRPGPEVIKIFMLNSAEHEIFPANKC